MAARRAVDWHWVIAELGRMGVAFIVRMEGKHIKCGCVNFYPTTGRIFIDGDKQAQSQRGYKAFLHVLEAQNLKRK